jgi:hypothetical protein
VKVANIRSRKVGGEECWNFGLDGRLEAVAASIHLKAVVASIHLEAAAAATSEAARLQETLPQYHGWWTHMRTLQDDSLTR